MDKQRNGRILQHELFLFVLKMKMKTPKYRLGKVTSMEINTGRSVKYR
jgi:hypothetical protein